MVEPRPGRRYQKQTQRGRSANDGAKLRWIIDQELIITPGIEKLNELRRSLISFGTRGVVINNVSFPTDNLVAVKFYLKIRTEHP